VVLSTGPLNRLLEREPWARERLAAFAGRTFLVRVGPVTSLYRIAPRGLLEAVPLAGITPDLTLALSPLDVPAFLADPRRFHEFVDEAGDPALANAIAELATTLPWFVEQAFARSLGPVAGQRLADAGRRILGFPEYAARRVAANVGTYARDEVRVLAHPADMRTLVEDTAFLDARIDALDARVAALDARFRERSPG
jgi:ubiquinone biosynthesis accessory factor UbiJ